MNYREQFIQIKNFLKPYQKIWENEIMLLYPNPLDGFNLEWIEDLRRFQDKNDVIRLEKKEVFDYIENQSLKDFYHKIKLLSQLPRADQYAPMPEDRFTWLFIIPKKQHEIKRLSPHLNYLYQSNNIKQVIDVGGGIGLLAQTLNNYYQMSVISVDMNATFQKTGIERHIKNAKNPDNRVEYQLLKVSDNKDFTKLLGPNVMALGLHTCGKLALDLMRVCSKQRVPVLVNFGCCYHTLDEGTDLQNISQFAQNHDPLWMNKFALTLSCRAHRKMDEEDYIFKLKVKYFRYAIHILLYDHYEIRHLISLGNSSPKLYDSSFGHYAIEQLGRINIVSKHSIEELNDFFKNNDLNILIQKMLAAGLIRDALGRVMELYLQLDRAIYLEEQGYKVHVQEFFDEELSPRNIGITAELNSGEKLPSSLD
jgi:hypothetical protein